MTGSLPRLHEQTRAMRPRMRVAHVVAATLAAALAAPFAFSADAAPRVVAGVERHEHGLTLAAGALPVAADGKVLVMTVDGVETPVAAGDYHGVVVLEPLDGAKTDFFPSTGGGMGPGGPPAGAMPGAMPGGGPGGPPGAMPGGPAGGPPGAMPGGGGEGPGDTVAGVYRSALLVEGGAVARGKSATSALRGGRHDGHALRGVKITTRSPNFNGVSVVDQDYAIRGATIDVSGDGGNDMSGLGSGVAVFKGGHATIDHATITTHGTARAGVFGGSYDSARPARVTLRDTTIVAQGHNTVKPTSIWLLGLFGDVRAVQYVGYYDNTYDHVTIKSAGWAVLSVDGVKPASSEALRKSGLTAAWDAQHGYGARLPHDLLTLYPWSGRNTVRNSELAILGRDAGGWGDGYGSYSIGANLNRFENTHIANVSYGSIVANEYASVAFTNGTVVDSNRFGVYSHSNKGGVILVDHARFNTREPVFLLKSAAGMFGPNATMVEVNHSVLANNGNGTILLLMDNDDPGMGKTIMGADGKTAVDEMIEVDDRPATRDEHADLLREVDWQESRFMEGGASYQFNAIPSARFADCTGAEAIHGDFYNARRAAQNLVLRFDHCEVEGAISAGTARHRVDGILKNMKQDEADYVRDGVRYGNRNHLGRVDVTAGPVVNNGVIAYLANGSTWKPRAKSWLSKLVVSADSRVEGTVAAATTTRDADGNTVYTGVTVGQ